MFAIQHRSFEEREQLAVEPGLNKKTGFLDKSLEFSSDEEEVDYGQW